MQNLMMKIEEAVRNNNVMTLYWQSKRDRNHIINNKTKNRESLKKIKVTNDMVGGYVTEFYKITTTLEEEVHKSQEK